MEKIVQLTEQEYQYYVDLDEKFDEKVAQEEAEIPSRIRGVSFIAGWIAGWGTIIVVGLLVSLIGAV